MDTISIIIELEKPAILFNKNTGENDIVEKKK
jgi:hypothetical protein